MERVSIISMLPRTHKLVSSWLGSRARLVRHCRAATGTRTRRCLSSASVGKSPVRVRYAPSPTGELHLGGLRTALYNYLFAKRTGGTFILRLEDTDQTRLVPGSAENLERVLDWAGLSYDEGPSRPGAFGPYVQSQRLDLYKQHAEQLISSGHAYRCFCTKERLERLRELALKAGRRTYYDGFCSQLTPAETEEKASLGVPHVVRFRVEPGQTQVRDEIRGRVTIPHHSIDDQVLLKSDGFPTYHLANVVDDHLMQISHVIRGEEWLVSTAKHVLLYSAFGWPEPQFFHLPLLLDSSRAKLSKRHGDVAVESFMEKGYTPESLVNFVSLLGWTPRNESYVLTMSDLEDQFDLHRVHKSNAIVDYKRLDWISSQHLRRKIEMRDPSWWADAWERLRTTYGDCKLDEEYAYSVVRLLRERVDTMQDVVNYASVYFRRPHLDSEEAQSMREKAWVDRSADILALTSEKLSALSDTDIADEKAYEALLSDVRSELGMKKSIFPTLRYVLTAQKIGPGIAAIMSVLGREETLARLQAHTTG